MESALHALYGDNAVLAMITLKVDTKEPDAIANDIAKFGAIEDVFLVTGDTDIVAKARFRNYKELKEFVVRSLDPISGIKDTKTLMVVTAYKESGAPGRPREGFGHGAREGSQMDIDAKLKQTIDVLEQLSEDTSVPRNIRRGAADAKTRLLKSNEALDVRVAGAISIMDDLANDPNIPLHGRTLIWNIISQLETVKV